MGAMVITITKVEFLQGYEKGYVNEVVLIDNYLYGRDNRGNKAELKQEFTVVRCAV